MVNIDLVIAAVGVEVGEGSPGTPVGRKNLGEFLGGGGLLLAAWMALALVLLPISLAQAQDRIFDAAKYLAYPAAMADAATTVRMIQRGNVEGNAIHNLLIDKRDDAPVRRVALLAGQTYLATRGLEWLYGKSRNRLYRWALTGVRVGLNVDMARCAWRNSQLGGTR